MLRVIAVLLGLTVLVLLLIRVFREMRALDVDWTGVTFALGFIALAFYLRHTTGLG